MFILIAIINTHIFNAITNMYSLNAKLKQIDFTI